MRVCKQTIYFFRDTQVDPVVFEGHGTSDEDQSDHDVKTVVEKSKKKSHNRQKWTTDEVKELQTYFKTYLESEICPRTKSVDEAKKLSRRRNGKIWMRSNDKIIKKISNMNHKVNR